MIEQFKQAIEGAIQGGDFNNWVREEDREKAAEACVKICDEKMIEFMDWRDKYFRKTALIEYYGIGSIYSASAHDRSRFYTTSQLLKLFKERK